MDSGGAASGTNQIAELTAILQAILAHNGSEPLLIESDSQYAIRCSSDWLPGWKKKGWRTAGGSPVKNLDLVKAIDLAISRRPGPVRFRWVRGHVGNPFNERADQLAGIAARDWAAGRGDSTQGLITPDDLAQLTGPDSPGGPDHTGLPNRPGQTDQPDHAGRLDHQDKVLAGAAATHDPADQWQAVSLF